MFKQSTGFESTESFAPVADEVCVNDDGIPLKEGDSGGAPESKVAHLISFAGDAAHLHREINRAHLIREMRSALTSLVSCNSRAGPPTRKTLNNAFGTLLVGPSHFLAHLSSEVLAFGLCLMFRCLISALIAPQYLTRDTGLVGIDSPPEPICNLSMRAHVSPRWLQNLDRARVQVVGIAIKHRVAQLRKAL